MERISREIYETIQNDIESINKALENIIGSKMMYDELSVKYEIIFPELSKILTKVGGKISFGGEFDFRPELRRIKSALLTKLMVSELEPEINTDIYNSAKVIVNTHLQVADITVNELIEESKLYIRKNSIDEKQIALEKIWDAFERFKTYFGEDKKKSILQILKIVSNGNQSLFEELEKECRSLTDIGNKFQIRHFEINKSKLDSVESKEYLYFRMLSFLGYCIPVLSSSKI
ncbi:hypothetical protein Q7W37_11910 [Streptococcus suis]|nr:hypothetical protein [Streptococcus suis]